MPTATARDKKTAKLALAGVYVKRQLDRSGVATYRKLGPGRIAMPAVALHAPPSSG